jgi:glutathione S-transferase
MRTPRKHLAIPLAGSLQAAVDDQETSLRERLQVCDLPLSTRLFLAKDGRGGTDFVCHVHLVFLDGLASDSEGRSREPLRAIQAAFDRMASHVRFCLKWAHLRPSLAGVGCR